MRGRRGSGRPSATAREIIRVNEKSQLAGSLYSLLCDVDLLSSIRCYVELQSRRIPRELHLDLSCYHQELVGRSCTQQFRLSVEIPTLTTQLPDIAVSKLSLCFSKSWCSGFVLPIFCMRDDLSDAGFKLFDIRRNCLCTRQYEGGK